MGSPDNEEGRNRQEGPVHKVTFASGLWMGKYEVTQSQWQAVMGFNPASESNRSGAVTDSAWAFCVGGNYPVFYVSWNDIQVFEQTLGGAYRLPSESEWEYACRAGTTTRFYWGDDDSLYEKECGALCAFYGENIEWHEAIPIETESVFNIQIGNYAWYDPNSGGYPHPVGGKTPNAWGLFDMSGNVSEFCEDWLDHAKYVSNSDYTDAPTDGRAWITPSGSNRIARGGSCINEYYRCRSANRGYFKPDYRDFSYGFRLVRDAD